MKNYLQIPAFIVMTLIPATLIAQEPATGIIQKPVMKFYSGIDSIITKQNLQITPILPSNSTTLPFQHYLQTRLNKNKNIYTEQPTIVSPYQYNMPILKPEKTSKILLAELDPDFPYTYNMPVKDLAGEK